MVKRKRKSRSLGTLFWLAGLLVFLILVVASIYSFEFVQIFFNFILSNIGINSEIAQKVTIIGIAFIILLVSRKGIKKAFNRLLGM